MQKRRELAAVLTLCAILTLFWGDVLFLGRGLYQRDLTVYHFPMKKVVRDLIVRGEFPSWDPMHAAGQPLAANPAYEVFYPPQWLTLLPSYPFGFSLHIVFHFYLAAIGMYLLLRSFECERTSAFIGALLFSLGGPLLSLTKLLPFLFSVAWAPWIFLFARRALEQRRLRDFSLAAFFAGMQGLVAEPTTLMQMWGVLLSYGAYRTWRDRQEETGARRFRPLALMSGVILGGAMLAAVQLVPAIDFSRDTVRSRAWPLEVVSRWSLPLARPLEMIVPQYFRLRRSEGGESRLNELYPQGDPFIADFYLGLLALATIAVFVKHRPRGSGYGVALILASYLVAIGGATPVLRWLYGIGLFRAIRYPEKFALTAAVVLVVAAGIALDRLFRGEARDWRVARMITLVWTLVMLVAVLTSSGLRPADPTSALEVTTFGMHSISPREFWMRNLLRGIALLIILLAIEKRPARMHFWRVALVVFVVADLWHLRSELAPAQPKIFFAEPSLAVALAPERSRGRLFHAADWDWADGTPLAESVMAGSAQPWRIRNGLFPRTSPAWGIPLVLEQDFDETHLLNSAEFLQAANELRQRGQNRWAEILGAMSNVAWRADFDPALTVSAADVERGTPVRISSVIGNPRFYLASQVVQAAGRAEFVDLLARENFPLDVAFVDRPSIEAGKGSVRVLSERPSSIRLEVSATMPAFLVASVTAHRYWEARVDGRSVPIVSTNLAYQGVPVPPGRHLVTFGYRNPLLLPSGLLSGLVAALLGLGMIFGTRPRSASA